MSTVRKQERFIVLLHHVTVGLLREKLLRLKGRAAPGVDGVTRHEYETGSEGRLADLHKPGAPRNVSGEALAESLHSEG